MLQNRLRITVLLVSLILVTIPAALGATPSTTDQNQVITAANNGKTIFLEKGETFYLKLLENPSTGYSWKLNLSKGLQLKKDKYVPGSPRVMGASGTHLWVIKAVNSGCQYVNGIYKRPWEHTTRQDKTFKLKIKVKKY